ncbi:MAG: IS3 family transposase [Lentihominibacter sp.]
MESFFATFKQEELYRVRYRSERDFKESIKRFMDFCNNERLNDELGYIPPSKYEESCIRKLKEQQIFD